MRIPSPEHLHLDTVMVLVPGDLITQEALEHLRSGVLAGMELPDPTGAKLEKLKVVARS